MYLDYLPSPAGTLKIAGSHQGIVRVAFVDAVETAAQPHRVIDRCKTQLERYFAGQLTHFDLPLQPQGTPFQLAVWRCLLTIPFGTTVSYGNVAAAIGRPKAMRAVGAANGKNPLSIIVPCHRVIGQNGKLTGYAGGLDRKQWLLAHEGFGQHSAMTERGQADWRL